MKSKYLPLLVGETGIKVMKRMKQVFDPEGVLNPGKIFVDMK
jgi:glycolate oxidase